MAQIDRLQELRQIFEARRYPIKLGDLLAQVDYSPATLKRYIRTLREHGAPIRFDQKTQGYILDKSEGDAFQLPGLWFNVSELHSLLTIHELIEQLGPGLLKLELQPLRARIEKQLAARGVATGELRRRIAFQGIGIRLCCPLAFRTSATALLARRRLKLNYHSRGQDRVSSRQVSPQKLIYYRGNWYLAVFCHTRKALRVLALERMSEIVPLETACQEVGDDELRPFLTASFGIFTGSPKEQAVLRFSREAARWVADERWHPDQQSQTLADGSYELRLPYSDQRELLMEVLRFGPDVEVMAPESLRQAVCERLRGALGNYEEI